MKNKSLNKVFFLISTLIILLNWICKDKLILKITFITYLCLATYKLAMFSISFRHSYNRTHTLKSNFLSFLKVNHKVFYHILIQESIILNYGFLIWRKPKSSFDCTFDSYKKNPNTIVYFVMIFLVLMESALVDFLLIKFSYYVLAKIAIISSIYLIIIFLSHVKALKYRSTFFTEENLIIRYGIMSELIIPYASISPENYKKGNANIVALGLLSKMEKHNTFVLFKETLSIPRIYGITKMGNGVSLHISDSERFNKLLVSYLK